MTVALMPDLAGKEHIPKEGENVMLTEEKTLHDFGGKFSVRQMELISRWWRIYTSNVLVCMWMSWGTDLNSHRRGKKTLLVNLINDFLVGVQACDYTHILSHLLLSLSLYRLKNILGVQESIITCALSSHNS